MRRYVSGITYTIAINAAAVIGCMGGYTFWNECLSSKDKRAAFKQSVKDGVNKVNPFHKE